MKQLSIYILALLLVVGTSAALAGEKRHGDRHDRNQGNHYRHQDKHYKHFRHYRHVGHHYYRPYDHRRHHFGKRRYRNYSYSSYLGAALIGSALTQSLYHTHAGTACYQDHARDSYRERDSSYSEVVGCYRIERLPDGSERRVEVPLSDCN